MKHSLFICDPEPGKWEEMVDYIISNNIEMYRYEITDVSDVLGWDDIAKFDFKNEQDAVIFKLKFSNGNNC